MSNVFAFFVGIDRYAGNVAQLRGCVNDVEALSDVLHRRFAAAGDTLTTTMLTNEDATRNAFLAEFPAFFSSCAAGDNALLYCSMHGSQEKAGPEFLAIEPDGYNETLVFHDSRTAGGHDIADKELSVLIGELSARGVVVTVVLDCCHSGSGLRGLLPEVGVRCAPPDLRTRSAADYLPRAVPNALPGANAATAGRTADLGARYTLLAACRSDQTAKETPVAGVHRGALSQALEQLLVSTPGAISNLDVVRSVSARVRSRVIDQTPQLECPQARDFGLAFIGGKAAPSGSLFTVSHTEGQWRLDAGRVQGIPAPGPDGGVRIALYPLDAGTPAAVLATATVTAAGPSSSTLRFDPPGGVAALDPTQGYRAVVTAWPRPATTVAVAAEVPGREALVTAIGAAGALAVADDDDADLLITRADDEIVLCRRGSTQPIVAEQPADSLDTVRLVAETTQVGRWLALSRLDNPGTGIAATDVTLELLATDGTALPTTDGGIVVEYGATGQQPRVQVRIRNNSKQRLFVALLDLSELFGVSVANVEGNGLLDPASNSATGETFAIADDGTHDLYLEVPNGQTRVTDVLKLLVSTAPFDPHAWSMSDLEPPTTLSRAAISAAADKGLSGRPAADAPTDDWTTREVVVTTIRPASDITLDGSTPTVQLSPAVTLHVPAGLAGTVAIVTHADAGRDALVRLLPPVLADDPASEPFAFIPTRSVGAETDVLQFTWGDAQRSTATTITADNPLRMTVDQPLADGEVVLPIAFDGEDYLPVGYGRTVGSKTEIVIDRLPSSDVGLRSLGGSLKILFRKLVLRRVGADYDWPHLSVVDYSTDPPSYDWDPGHVKAALAGKATALLLVHGIIGDTVGMSASVGAGTDPVKNRFDVVLAFDYENINTPIEQTGADLAQRLKAVGIGVDGGARVTALVHSMGGLVTRSCIEQHGGATLIERLITCGTPHGGSPWSRIEDLALSLIGLGCNSVVPLGPPLAVAGRLLGYLTKLVEKIDNTLDEMKLGSPLLVALAADADPGLPYTTIRGTRPWPDTADDARAKRIIGKLATVGFDAVFSGAVNDMAVSLASASAVGDNWTRPPARLDAACNHISYFSSDDGRAAIASAIDTALAANSSGRSGTAGR